MDGALLLRAAAALLLVTGLIALAALIARRFAEGRGMLPAKDAARLAVLESRLLDGRRRLTLVRCDGREYLLLLGATGETVVDRFPLLERTGDA